MALSNRGQALLDKNEGLAERYERIVGAAEKGTATADGHYRNLIALKDARDRAAADLEAYKRRMLLVPLLNDLDDNGNKIVAHVSGDDGEVYQERPLGEGLGEHQTTSELKRLERRLGKADERLTKANSESTMQKWETSWLAKRGEAETLINELATQDLRIRFAPEPDLAPSVTEMRKHGKVALDGRTELDKVRNSHATYEEALAVLRARMVPTEPPMRLSVTSPKLARALRIPLVSTRWDNGNTAPSHVDIEGLLYWLGGDALLKKQEAQLERWYADAVERGATIMGEATRRSEVSRLSKAIHSAELLEAAHLWGLLESGFFLPTKHISARALLGLA